MALELPEASTLRNVADEVIAQLPQLSWIPAVCRPARNLEYGSWEDPVGDGDEVSFIPPVSGGTESAATAVESPVHVRITSEPLDPAPLVAFAARPHLGGVVTFSGNVRSENRGRQVHYLEYEAYLPMAERELAAIASEAVERWGGRVAIEHRLGRLEIGDPSVIVVAACGHRVEAFESCRYCIDALKERVPIWKREVWADGEVWIEGAGEAAVHVEQSG